jgi:hypothetical protein
MSQPYFYLLKHTKSGKYYAGCKYGKTANPKDLMTEHGYKTSSKTVQKLISLEGVKSFEIVDIILEEEVKIPFGFNNIQHYEQWYLKENKCSRSRVFLNKSDNTPYDSAPHVTGKSTYIDENGIQVFIDIVSANALGLKSIKSGTVSVADGRGNFFRVDKNDPRLKSGELFGCRKGMKRENAPKTGKVCAITKDGNKEMVSIDDPRLLSGEIRSWSKGKITVEDNLGNTFNVDKNDPRLLSGEVRHISKGRKWIHNPFSSERRMIKKDQPLPEGWLWGGGPRK